MNEEHWIGMKRLATVIIFSVLALLSLGLVMLYSVTPPHASARFLSRQALGMLLGTASAGFIILVGYKRLRSIAWILYALAVVLLASVLVIGVEVNGARRWFRFGGVQFQPSDFAKFALVVLLAHYGAYCQRLMRTFRRGVLYPSLLIGPVVALVFLEPDWGTAALLGCVSLVLLIVGGARWVFILPPVLLGGAAVCVMLAKNPVRSERVYSWLHLEETREGVGYQVWRAREALKRGAFFGVGLNKSKEKALLPEHQTDFIFAIIGEEFGFAGSICVIGLFLTLFVAGVVAAWRAPDTFGMLLATGISFLIGLQALINLMVVSGAAPNKGLALPFISYGGSNLTMMLTCTGALVSVALSGSSGAMVGLDAEVTEELAVT